MRTEAGELLLATDDPFSAEQAAWAPSASARRSPGASCTAAISSPISRARGDAARARRGERGSRRRGRRGPRRGGPLAQGDRGREKRGGAPGALDAARCAQDRRERHPPRDRGRGLGDQVPHRRHPDPDQADRGPGAGRAGDRARQGARRARRHRAPRAAGRALQGARPRPRDRLPRLDHAEHPRRGRGAARARQAVALRARARRFARQPRVRGARHQGAAACRTSRYGMLLVTGRPAAARPPRSTPRSARSTRARTRSSPSRTRSSTSFRACCRSR